MSDNRFKINHKEQRAVAGNWGHPRKFIKKITKIADPLYPDKPIKSSKKYKKKVKKPYIAPYKQCPFCGNELKELPKIESKGLGFYVSIFVKYERECIKCGAKRVEDCPCCHRHTWLLNETYKHQWLGCGFEGEKL